MFKKIDSRHGSVMAEKNKKKTVLSKVLISSKAFKQFWKDEGPYKYALTCQDYPPVLLEADEWLFSDDLAGLLKALLGYDHKKVKIVHAPFNPAKKAVLRPDQMIPWKIDGFPSEWDAYESDLFTPEGHLTTKVLDQIDSPIEAIGAEDVETAFFDLLPDSLESMGYTLLAPGKGYKTAAIQSYLKEWEEDDAESGY
jgi:hypothetical protein